MQNSCEEDSLGGAADDYPNDGDANGDDVEADGGGANGVSNGVDGVDDGIAGGEDGKAGGDGGVSNGAMAWMAATAETATRRPLVAAAATAAVSPSLAAA